MDHPTELKRPLAKGELLQEYRIERILGQGGFAYTYLALDTNLETQVAIKEYFPDGLAFRHTQTNQVHAQSRDQDDYFNLGLQRFLREGKILASFKHPNIVRIFRALQANNTAYLIMDFEAGETLQHYLDRKSKPLDYEEIQDIILPILDGLREVHKHDLLHLDIKPDNIFLRSNSSPALIDFGGARQFIDRNSKSVSSMVESAGYSPPEQYTTESIQGPWSDIYALAATLYYCISNEIPAPGNDRSQSIIDEGTDPLKPAVDLGKDRYPKSLLQAIDLGLTLARKKRPQNAREFQRLLTVKEATVVPEQPAKPKPHETSGVTQKANQKKRSSTVIDKAEKHSKDSLEQPDQHKSVDHAQENKKKEASQASDSIDDTLDTQNTTLEAEINTSKSTAMIAILMVGIALFIIFINQHGVESIVSPKASASFWSILLVSQYSWRHRKKISGLIMVWTLIAIGMALFPLIFYLVNFSNGIKGAIFSMCPAVLLVGQYLWRHKTVLSKSAMISGLLSIIVGSQFFSFVLFQLLGIKVAISGLLGFLFPIVVAFAVLLWKYRKKSISYVNFWLITFSFLVTDFVCRLSDEFLYQKQSWFVGYIFGGLIAIPFVLLHRHDLNTFSKFLGAICIFIYTAVLSRVLFLNFIALPDWLGNMFALSISISCSVGSFWPYLMKSTHLRWLNSIRKR